MKYHLCEIYYNDGGHCGPFADFHSAYCYAIKTLRGSESTTRIEIRPAGSTARGGYASGNDGSYYVTKNDLWSSAH